MLRFRFEFDILQAGQIMAYIAMTLTLICPLIGYLSDKINRRIQSLAFASLLLTISHFYAYVIPDHYRSLHIVAPITLYEVGLGLFMTNIWAALK